MLVRHRRENVERAMPAGREGRISDAGILNVKRWIAAQDMLILDFVEVPLVILRDVDVVMWQVEATFDPEIHHEGRARVLLFGELSIGPTPPQFVWNELLHGAGEVGIYDHCIGFVGSVPGTNSDRFATCKKDLFHGLIEVNLNAEPLCNACQRCRDGAATTDRMPDTVLVFEKAQDAEQARTPKRRHAEIL